VDLLLQQAVERVDTCGCNDGCPECKCLYYSRLISGITSPVCKEGNIVTSKIGAVIILKSLLNITIDVDNLPFGDERGTTIETVVPVNDLVKEAVHVMKFQT
jgi:DEAD/DEAH box helicase domain-containing protein